ncbi:MAG: cytidylate kinase family protein [Thermoguttaceae bacterium]|nr:cytidylate kinase family protein [Thermoguttaceae bacterium]
MKAITITREYGAGGSELAERLGEVLGWKVLDRELLHRAAQIEQVPDADLDRLDEKAASMADRLRLHPPHQKYLHGLTEAARQAAQQGDVVLVGRGARHLLGDIPDLFHLRLVAPRAWRAERMARREGWSPDQAHARCLEMDRSRDLFTRYFFGDVAARPDQYDLVVNTGRVALEDIASVVRDLVRPSSSETAVVRAPHRVLTLSRELGAGETQFAATLAERLSMQVYDRELIEQQAVRLGVPEAEIEKIDERAAGIFQRFRPGSIYQRYIETLEKIFGQLAEQGNVILMGRAGNCFLRDDRRVFHVRLIATMSVRLRRIMEYRWVRESVAKRLVDESDSQRRKFCESYFGVDWASPLEYHVTVNTGRLGPSAVDLVSLAATRHWNRAA